MKTYYIYHAPSHPKIGVSDNIPRRMKQQGFTEWEILEEHTDIYEVSRRELELQKEYGYVVDKLPYHISCQRLLNASIAGHTPEASLKRSNSLQGNQNRANSSPNKFKQARDLEILNKAIYMKRKDIAKEYKITERTVYRILKS